MRRERFIGVVCVALWRGACAAQPAPDGAGADVVQPGPDAEVIAVFERAREALETGVTFRARVVYEGMLAGLQPDIDAFVRLRRESGDAAPWAVRVTGTATKKGETTEFDVAWSEAEYSWIDQTARKLMERPLSQARVPLVQFATSAVPTQFLEAAPYSKEMRAASSVREADEVLDGVDCEVVTVMLGRTSMRTTWAFGRADRIPRRIERVTETQRGASRTIITLTDVRAGESLDDEQMTLALPEGFELDASGANARPAQAEPAEQDAAPSPPDAPPALPAAPGFEVKDSAGAVITLETLRGSPAVLVFGGSWSLPSARAEPEIQALQELLAARGGRVVVMAFREKNADALTDAYARNQRTYVLAPAADAAASAYRIVRAPTFVVLTPEGRVAARVEGFSPGAIDRVKAAVAAPAPETAPVPSGG